MADARLTYLAIQRELGGNEVILSAPLAELIERSREVGRSGSREVKPGLGNDLAGETLPDLPTSRPPDVPTSRRPDLPTSRLPDWRKGAPPIPDTPGIRVLAPSRELMDAPPAWETLEQVAASIAGCVDCFLCQGRRHTVPGEGNPRAQLMFIGEGPGQVEDETGRPFVGRAGELLTKMIEAIGLRRDEVFIANAVKCRPPQNRKPLPDELAACRRYLERQIELVRPHALVALGATAVETLLQVRRSLAELRGRVHSYRGIPLVVTYHPAALLRNPNWKKPAWDDIRIARQLLDR